MNNFTTSVIKQLTIYINKYFPNDNDQEISEQKLVIYVHKTEKKIAISVGDWCTWDLNILFNIVDTYAYKLREDYGVGLQGNGIFYIHIDREWEPYEDYQDNEDDEINWIKISFISKNKIEVRNQI